MGDKTMSTAAAHQGLRFEGFDWREVFRELYRRSKILTVTGWIHVILLAGLLVILPFDSRLVMGINPWIKPSKFASSITIFVWTVAWLLEYPRLSTRARAIISRGISISMLVEIVCIVTQAARGTTSHYNQSTPFNAVIFAAMGLTIVFSTILMVALLIYFFKGKFDIGPPYLWGIRSGLAIFLVASAIGGVMIAQKGHSVGVDDGGPGLPFVNWSTTGGDLRVAHFLGLHALQLLPISGFLISLRTSWTMSQRTTLVLALSAAYAVLVGLLYWQASQGSPLLRM
jgi:hypothetical protein